MIRKNLIEKLVCCMGMALLLVISLFLTSQIGKVNNMVDNIDNLEKNILKIEKEIDSLDVILEENIKTMSLLETKNRVLQRELDDKQNNVYFNKNDLNNKSNATEEQINYVLRESGLANLGNSYLIAEETYGVNAMFLVGITIQESGWGESNRAKTQNNLTGYAVYDNSSNGTTFNSKHESIMKTAKLLATDYLNKEGKYYNGTDIYSINEIYCPNDNYHWSNNILKIINQLIKEMNSL